MGSFESNNYFSKIGAPAASICAGKNLDSSSVLFYPVTVFVKTRIVILIVSEFNHACSHCIYRCVKGKWT